MSEDIVNRLRAMKPDGPFAPTPMWAPYRGADEIERLRAERDAARAEVERLRAALEPFALNAEAWTRSGFHPSETLTEGWPEMPMAADDEPSHFNGDFLEVRHLIAARAALQEGE